ncbi:MAG: DUF92 domain-containing protein [Clostridia bacterium]|nr:DUF92 domain-containing protein [Clostridia bacterium]
MKEIAIRIAFAVLAASLLALLAFLKKSLTKPALLLAWASAVVIGYWGGVGGFVILAVTFVFTVLSDKIGRSRAARQKSECRKLIQIVANVGTGTALLLILSLLKQTEIAFFLYASAMASSLADSMASGIGVLQKRDPVSILTWKRIPRGRSGGVSATGLLASLLGSALIAGCYAAFSGKPVLSLFVLAAGFLGALADSVYGALLQGKYLCSVDGAYTEKRFCHGEEARLIGGFRVIDNNIVNLMNNVTAAALAALVVLTELI